MLKKLYDHSRLWFTIFWIVAYCVLMSLGDLLSNAVGVERSVSLAVALLLSGSLFFFLKKNGLLSAYGLCRPTASPKAMLCYLPAGLLLSANLWLGVRLQYGAAETALYILVMLCVGFLEEVIFRGFLFHALKEDNRKLAVVISSVTFGMGHIINLINGSGTALLPNLLQVVYATAGGFMFVMLYLCSGSLLPCILTHGVFNALSVFSVEKTDPETQILVCFLLTLITGLYGAYLAIKLKDSNAAV